MNEYFLHGKLTAKDGMGSELAAILLEASRSLHNVEGCILYVVSRDGSDPDAVWVTEIWGTKADHDNSLKLATVKELIARAMPILDGLPEKGQTLEVLGGVGL